MIAVIDSGGANIASVLFALERLGAKAALTSDPAVITAADRVILPGVGAAANAIRALQEKNLTDCIKNLKQPVLGICLGMQILFARSEEGSVDMLNIIPGTVAKFIPAPNLTIPHMGWNNVSFRQTHPLFAGIAPDSHFYFVHSYRAPENTYTLGACDYGGAFSAIVAKDNFMGCQFHPERSGAAGAQLLKNFLEVKI